MKKGNISDAVIRRLPRYYRQLTDLLPEASSAHPHMRWDRK